MSMLLESPTYHDIKLDASMYIFYAGSNLNI